MQSSTCHVDRNCAAASQNVPGSAVTRTSRKMRRDIVPAHVALRHAGMSIKQKRIRQSRGLITARRIADLGAQGRKAT